MPDKIILNFVIINKLQKLQKLQKTVLLNPLHSI